MPMLAQRSRAVEVAAVAAAGLALADSSVVVLALPQILTDFEASVSGVAAVIGAYTLALALALPAAVHWSRGRDAARLGALGMLGFALACVGCGLAPSLALLIALRALQGIAASALLIAAFELLRAGEPGRRRGWVAAAVFGAAIGPALGGAVTELLDWRAIFLAQAPVVAAGAVASWRATPVSPPVPANNVAGSRLGGGELALGLLSAALTGVLFLLVLLLISGWALSPLAAAAVVSILPAAAFLGTRMPGDATSRAIVGCALVGAGVLSLAFLPLDTIAMTIAPQVVAGLGMGMALPALAGGLLPERTSGDAAHGLAVRHLGITLALAILAPVAAAQLDQAAVEVRERGTALILDAKLAPLDKLDLARVATADLDAIAPRAALRDSLERASAGSDGDDRPVYERLQRRADDTLVTAVNDAFAPAFLICGALALLAAGGLLAVARPRLGRAAMVASASAVLLVPAQAAIAATARPPAVTIRDPCEQRRLPAVGGVDGLLQDGVLVVVDQAACRFGSSREQLVLALVDERRARAYERDYGVNPRDLGSLVSKVLGP